MSKSVMDITFLTQQQIWGDDQGNGQLQVMVDYGTKTGMSDLAIVLGGLMGENTETSDNQRSGYVWSASSDGGGGVRDVRGDGDRGDCGPGRRLVGARPALPSSVTSSIKLSGAQLSKKICNGKVEVWEYGEYPQTIAADNVNSELEQAFEARTLKETGKKYTFDGEKVDVYNKPFTAKGYAEYEHNGKRYIRIEAPPRNDNSVLSTGRKPAVGEAYWIEVHPIEWLTDPSGVWVAKQALFAGVQFDRKKQYDGNFEQTDMKRYLQNYFAKDMQVSRSLGAHSSAAIGPSTASILTGREVQRQKALNNPTQGL
jgi:hypothetical protein